jgi:hypothetical protein
MGNRPLKNIDAEIDAVREKIGFATRHIDRGNALLAFQLLMADRTRRVSEDDKPSIS